LVYSHSPQKFSLKLHLAKSNNKTSQKLGVYSSMPSPQTELKVAQFLKAIIQGEKQLEAYRQVLVEQKGFDPYLTFNHLDKESKGSISPFSFCAFLK